MIYRNILQIKQPAYEYQIEFKLLELAKFLLKFNFLMSWVCITQVYIFINGQMPLVDSLLPQYVIWVHFKIIVFNISNKKYINKY